jgi:hypothetical protein
LIRISAPTQCDGPNGAFGNRIDTKRQSSASLENAAKQDFRKVATGFRTKILLRQKNLSKHSLARQRMFA